MADITRFFDRHTSDTGSYIDGQLLAHRTSAYQDIKIIETSAGRRFMLLDDITMLSDDTDYIYHEHMSHIPMACIEAPRKALVIGGGDGGVVTELCKYEPLDHIVLAELDGDVIEVSQQWLPGISKGLSDPRVEIRVGDGAAYLAAHQSAFDLVVIDSTDICDEAVDGEQPAHPLVTDAFYQHLKAALKPGGVAVQMLGSPVFYRKSMATMFERLSDRFASFRPMMMPCPFYISGDWCAGLLSNNATLEPRFDHLPGTDLAYFNFDIAKAALALPNDVKALFSSRNG